MTSVKLSFVTSVYFYDRRYREECFHPSVNSLTQDRRHKLTEAMSDMRLLSCYDGEKVKVGGVMMKRRCEIQRVTAMEARHWFRCYIGIGRLPRDCQWFIVRGWSHLPRGYEHVYQVAIGGQPVALVGRGSGKN